MSRLRAWRLLGLCCAACAVAGVAVVASGASASPVGPQPFAIAAASLTQDGQQLVWHVQLAHRFSPVALRKGGRSLCLLIGRASGMGALCVGSARGGRHAKLTFSQGAAGKPHAIAATISRSSRQDLTASFAPSEIGNSYKSIHWQVLSGYRGRNCDPAPASPLGCSTEFPSKPALARLHTPRVVGCVPSGAPYVTNGSRSQRVVALTFDDGPWSDTPQFLDILERAHVPATFFQIGRQVSVYGGAVDRRMLADGDMIGDHTWSHADVAGAGALARQQISDAAVAIRNLTGFTPCLFRAPGGAVSSALIAEARSMGFTTIQWDVDPRDWARPGTSAIYSNIIDHAQNGSIIIQHDGGGDRSQTLAALPREIATLRSRGYEFVTITQLLGQRLIYK